MKRIALLAGASLLFSAVLFPASYAEPGLDPLQRRTVSSPEQPVSSGPLHERSRTVRRYWTKERMKEARPADRMLGGTVSGTSPSAVALGEPMTIEPTAPESVATRRAGGTGGGLPFVRDEITNPSVAPFRAHGKVFFTWNGGDYVCSGTVVTSESESLVVTAGHCVYDEGSFSSNFMFHPGYRNGDAPFGEWTASELFTTTGWQSGDFDYDVGMAVMNLNSGDTIQDTVGARGIEFNRSTSGLEFEAIGYPAASPFNGEKMYRCTSDFGYHDGGSSSPLAIGCDMTGGSSGGGWVIEGERVNSVVSYGYPSLPDVLFGPYFGATIATLYETAGGTDPGEGPGPEPEPERVDHEIGLTLTLRGHLRAKGRMSVPDGYLPCRRNAPINIFRVTSSGESLVKSTRTGDDGRFSISLPDRAGRYYAFGPEGEVDALNNCLAASTWLVRHRH